MLRKTRGVGPIHPKNSETVHGPLEIEVKFYLSEIKALRDRLLAMGAVHCGRTFENNIRFEDASNSLKNKGILLRLRKDDRIRLTLKSSLPRTDAEFKIHRELEIDVGDFDVCHSILQHLGFRPVQSYEKWRETFVLNDTYLLIDTMPYGVFLEIEGQKSRIRDMADLLGVRWKERIIFNYLEIFTILQREEGLPFNDITFENFKATHLDMRKHVTLLHAG